MGDWYRAADFLDDVLIVFFNRRSVDYDADVGNQVAVGRLCFALSAISKSFAVEPEPAIVLLATFGRRQHSHMLALVELCTRLEGIEVLWAEAGTPAKELPPQIRSWKPQLVILCAADQCADGDLLARAYGEISTACKEQGVDLVIGFAGNWPDSTGYGHHCHSFGDLKGVLCH